MSRRYEAAAAKLELLIEHLESEGVISESWANALRESGDDPGRARSARDARRAGRGPPIWANVGGGGSDTGGGNSGQDGGEPSE